MVFVTHLPKEQGDKSIRNQAEWWFWSEQVSRAPSDDPKIWQQPTLGLPKLSHSGNNLHHPPEPWSCCLPALAAHPGQSAGALSSGENHSPKPRVKGPRPCPGLQVQVMGRASSPTWGLHPGTASQGEQGATGGRALESHPS